MQFICWCEYLNRCSVHIKWRKTKLKRKEKSLMSAGVIRSLKKLTWMMMRHSPLLSLSMSSLRHQTLPGILQSVHITWYIKLLCVITLKKERKKKKEKKSRDVCSFHFWYRVVLFKLKAHCRLQGVWEDNIFILGCYIQTVRLAQNLIKNKKTEIVLAQN